MTYVQLLKKRSRLKLQIEDCFWSIPSAEGLKGNEKLEKLMKEHAEIEAKILSLTRGTK